jgi:hypothetical protein
MKMEGEGEQQSQVRKPFLRPRLRVYGHISDLTQTTLDPLHLSDGAGGPHHKTAA